MAARVLRSLGFWVRRSRGKGATSQARHLVVGVNAPPPEGARPAERGKKWADLKAGDEIVWEGKTWSISSVALADAEPAGGDHHRIESGRHWLSTGRFCDPPIEFFVEDDEPAPPRPKPRRRLFSLRFYLFSERGPATSFVVGIDKPCPGAAHLVHEKPWREVERGEEVRFGAATYYVGAIALEHCIPAGRAGQLVRSGVHWLNGGESHPLVPPEPPRPWSVVGRLLAGTVGAEQERNPEGDSAKMRQLPDRTAR